MLEKLKSLIGGKKAPSIDQLKEADALLLAELQTARGELEKLREQRDALYLEAMGKDEQALDALRLRIATSERTVIELQAAHAAASARIADTEAATAAGAIRARWDATRALLAEREQAGKRLDDALNAAAQALHDIQRLQEKVVAELPTQPNQTPMYWTTLGIEQAVLGHLAKRVPPLFARARLVRRDDEIPDVSDAIAESGALMLTAEVVRPVPKAA